MQLSKHITIGCDPELFLKDKYGANISAHGLVPGDKKAPHKLELGAVQLDGTAVEFNIEPAATAFEFEYRIDSVLGQVRKILPKEYSFDIVPSVIYSPGYFKKDIPESSKILGCDPDFDAMLAYTAPPRAAPNPTGTLRTAGGHIHVGWRQDGDPTDIVHRWDCREYVRDVYFAYQIVKPIIDADTKRGSLYGNFAAYRPKSYGVEFRTPSNAWLKYRSLWKWMFEFHREIFLANVDTGKRVGREIYNQYYNAYWGSSYDIKITNKKKEELFNKACNKMKMPELPQDWNKEVYA